MSHTPTQNTLDSPSVQLLREMRSAQPRKRVPLALLELNGVKVASNRPPHSPPKQAWVPVTPARITLRSPSVYIGSSLPLLTRTPARKPAMPFPGKENIPPYEGSSVWSTPEYVCTPVECKVQGVEVVSDNLQSHRVGSSSALTNDSEQVSETADKHCGSWKVFENPANQVTRTMNNIETAYSPENARYSPAEYLRKDHYSPLAYRDIIRTDVLRNTPLATQPPPQDLERSQHGDTEKTLGPFRLKSPVELSSSIGSAEGSQNTTRCTSYSPRSAKTSASEATHPTTDIPRKNGPIEGLSHEEYRASLEHKPDEERKKPHIPMYKLISPAGICLPLPPVLKRTLPSGGKKESEGDVSTALESSRDIVRFKPSTFPASVPPPAVSTGAREEPESRIPVLQLHRKVLPLRRSRKVQQRLAGKSATPPQPPMMTPEHKSEPDGNLPERPLPQPSPFCSVAESLKTSSKTSSWAAGGAVVASDEEMLGNTPPLPELESSAYRTQAFYAVQKVSKPQTCYKDLDLFLPNLPSRPFPTSKPTRRLSTSHSETKTSIMLQRTTSMPLQVSQPANLTRAKKRARGKKNSKPVEGVAVRKLFDMGPPPPTPEEDKRLQFYGSKYDWYRGLRF